MPGLPGSRPREFGHLLIPSPQVTQPSHAIREGAIELVALISQTMEILGIEY